MGAGPLVVVMGVSGSGKSTVGALVADRLNVPFCEGDALHPAANLAKVRAGAPLDDEDREPWLSLINAWLRAHTASGGVAACSALARRYRDQLREGLSGALRLVLLDPTRAELERRLVSRSGHFMPLSLLDTQLVTLERPEASERVLCLQGCGAPAETADQVRRGLPRVEPWTRPNPSEMTGSGAELTRAGC